MKQLAVGLLLIVMMLAIGLRTPPAEVARVLRQPRQLLLTLGANVLAIPLLTWLITLPLGLPPETMAGFYLCAASPGGPAGALFAARARGHLPTASSAMVCLSLVSVFTAPLSLALLLGPTLHRDPTSLMLPMLRTLVMYQLIPLTVGMALLHFRPLLAGRLAGPMSTAANSLLLMLVVGLLVVQGRVLLDIGAAGLFLSVLLVALNLGVGAGLSLEAPLRRALSLVTGVRNLSLALLLSAAFLPSPQTDAAVLTFGFFSMVLPWILAQLWSRRPLTEPGLARAQA